MQGYWFAGEVYEGVGCAAHVTGIRFFAIFAIAIAVAKQPYKVKWVMPWELFLIHRQSTKDAFGSKLRMFGRKELLEECAKIVVKQTAICQRKGVHCIAVFVLVIAVANQPYK